MQSVWTWLRAETFSSFRLIWVCEGERLGCVKQQKKKPTSKSNRLNLITAISYSHDYKATTYSSVWLWSNQDLYALTKQMWRCHAHGTYQCVLLHHDTHTKHNHMVHNTKFFDNTITTPAEITEWIHQASAKLASLLTIVLISSSVYLSKQNKFSDFSSNAHKVCKVCR